MKIHFYYINQIVAVQNKSKKFLSGCNRRLNNFGLKKIRKRKTQSLLVSGNTSENLFL